jgi:anti-sigma regulatory factor (Ser/Thr protein kinase)
LHEDFYRKRHLVATAPYECPVQHALAPVPFSQYHLLDVRNLMQAMAPVGPTELHQCRLRLPASPIAASLARKEVSAAITAWAIDIDPEAAVLLTSELVANAVLHDGGGTILLTISCCHCQLRVDVHDASRELPVPAQRASLESETGRGLMLVESMSDEWGYYWTTNGKAVFFTLAFPPDQPSASDISE